MSPLPNNVTGWPHDHSGLLCRFRSRLRRDIASDGTLLTIFDVRALRAHTKLRRLSGVFNDLRAHKSITPERSGSTPGVDGLDT